MFSTRCQNSPQTETPRGLDEKLHLRTQAEIWLANLSLISPSQGNLRYTGHLWTESGLILPKSKILSLHGSQRMYKPVKVGLRYTLVSNAEVSLHTNTPRKGRVELFSFLRVSLRSGYMLFKCEKKIHQLRSHSQIHKKCHRNNESTLQVSYIWRTNQPHGNPRKGTW